jgi:hypothetical protein
MPKAAKIPCFQPFGCEVHGKHLYIPTKAVTTNEVNFLKLLVPGINIPESARMCFKCRIHYNKVKKTVKEPKISVKRSRIFDAIVTGLRRKSPNSIDRAADEFNDELSDERIHEVLNTNAIPPGNENISPQRSELSADSENDPIIPSAPMSTISEYREDDQSKADKINKIMKICDQSPFDRKKSRSVLYSSRKLEKASKAVSEEISKASRRPITPRQILPKACDNCENLINRMIPKFQQLASRVDKYKLLTSLPQTVTIAEMVEKFKCSQYMARVVSQLRRDQGPFSAPAKKDHYDSKITPETRQLVVDFYISNENSRVMPGMRDTIYVKNPITGIKEQKAKREMLMSQADFYAEFSNCNPGIRIGFTSLGMLRPKYCVWPGATGFMRTCMCEIHQNFDLLLSSLNIAWNLHQVLDGCLCDATSERCSMGLCNECPNYDILQEILTPRNDLEEINVGRAPQDEGVPDEDFAAQRQEFIEDDAVHYFQWTREGRTNLVEKIAPRHEILESLMEMIPKIAEHHFLLKLNQFFKELKVSVRPEDSVIVHMDFAENYDFRVQDEVQGYHWTNNQMTIHPFYCIWSKNGTDLYHKTFAVLSDCLEHNANSVEVFRNKFMEHIKADIPNLKKIYFCSDGTGAQYKNFKNFLNTMELAREHALEVEIHFTVSYHGKSECDAMSAQIKRSLRLASLRDKKFITTTEAALKFCVEKLACETLNFIYVKKEMVAESKARLDERYRGAKTIPGTRSFHCVRFLQHGEIDAKPYSLCIQGKRYQIGRVMGPGADPQALESVDQIEVGSYLVINMLGIKTLGRVEAIRSEDGGFIFKPMNCRKGANSFRWPFIAHSLFISFDDVLFKVDNPMTEDGSVYKLYPAAYEMYDA